ncbi:hypothetical protein DKX38_023497 [Salix brachista]|uniref:Uncharacterized protein n=1 Tax=Salix brachista TaxID=2182728 RepID=A0A5N5JJ23_9ROSI|nr:hypothetical protein DKX38_023497 [Salix brachista]
MACNISVEKPHAVCIPAPTQSHIKLMLKLAKLLHCKGFHVTFVNTEFNHRRLLKSRGPDSMNGLPNFRFESIPDGLPSSDENATQNTREISEASREGFLAPFNDLLDKLNDTESSDVPPVTCIVSDWFHAGRYRCCCDARSSYCSVLHYICMLLHGVQTISGTQRKRSYTTKRYGTRK